MAYNIYATRVRRAFTCTWMCPLILLVLLTKFMMTTFSCLSKGKATTFKWVDNMSKYNFIDVQQMTAKLVNGTQKYK